MNLLLILREEAVCLYILAFLMIYAVYFVKKNRFFIRLNAFALGHVIFDFITIMSVNHLKDMPLAINEFLHAIFYIFAILFCCELFRYVYHLTIEDDRKHSRIRIIYVVPFVYLIAIPFLKIEYLQGNGSMYSYGPSVFAGYALAMIFFFGGEVLLLTHMNKLSANVKKSLIPGFLLMTAAVILQIFIPELLATGAAITLVTLSVFFAVVNPLGEYIQKAYTDTTFHIKNRNAYTEALDDFNKKTSEELVEKKFAMVMFDMNSLKKINDRYGHHVGDEYLLAFSNILQEKLKSAFGIYRTGGDEFVAIYVEQSQELIQREVDQVETTCSSLVIKEDIALSISYGICMMNKPGKIQEVERRADEIMLANKRAYYEKTC